jgi:hypothetical protein
MVGIMGRALWVLALILLLLQPIEAATAPIPTTTTVGNNPLLSQAAQSQVSAYVVTQADIEAGKKAIVDEIIKNDDSNIGSLNNLIGGYMANLTQRIIIGAIGVNILVAGLVYYFLNKKTKDLTFQSVAMKRKRDDEDRVFMADNINSIRGQVEKLEDYMRTVIQPSLLSLEDLASQRRTNDGRPVYAGGQWGNGGGAPNQQEFGYPNNAMARPENVQRPEQAQGWVPNGNQYEQQNSGGGWYGPTSYQGQY